MSYVVVILPIVALVMSIVAAAMTLWNAILALRAKERARDILHAETSVHELIEIASRRPLNQEETERARRIIESAAQHLVEKDRILIDKGLNQSSKSGERRYIHDLMS